MWELPELPAQREEQERRRDMNVDEANQEAEEDTDSDEEEDEEERKRLEEERKRKRQVVTHAGYTKAHKQREERLLRDDDEAKHLEPIEKGSLLVVLSSEMEQVPGVSDAEASMPMTLCEATGDFVCESRDDEIEVRWWRQRQGDPNKAWTKGCLKGGKKPWVGKVDRGSVLLVGAELTNAKKLTAKTMKLLAETSKCPYSFHKGQGLQPKPDSDKRARH